MNTPHDEIKNRTPLFHEKQLRSRRTSFFCLGDVTLRTVAFLKGCIIFEPGFGNDQIRQWPDMKEATFPICYCLI